MRGGLNWNSAGRAAMTPARLAGARRRPSQATDVAARRQPAGRVEPPLDLVLQRQIRDVAPEIQRRPHRRWSRQHHAPAPAPQQDAADRLDDLGHPVAGAASRAAPRAPRRDRRCRAPAPDRRPRPAARRPRRAGRSAAPPSAAPHRPARTGSAATTTVAWRSGSPAPRRSRHSGDRPPPPPAAPPCRPHEHGTVARPTGPAPPRPGPVGAAGARGRQVELDRGRLEPGGRAPRAPGRAPPAGSTPNGAPRPGWPAPAAPAGSPRPSPRACPYDPQSSRRRARVRRCGPRGPPAGVRQRAVGPHVADAEDLARTAVPCRCASGPASSAAITPPTVAPVEAGSSAIRWPLRRQAGLRRPQRRAGADLGHAARPASGARRRPGGRCRAGGRRWDGAAPQSSLVPAPRGTTARSCSAASRTTAATAGERARCGDPAGRRAGDRVGRPGARARSRGPQIVGQLALDGVHPHPPPRRSTAAP